MLCASQTRLVFLVLPPLSSGKVVFATVWGTCHGMCTLLVSSGTQHSLMYDNTILGYVPFDGTTCLMAMGVQGFIPWRLPIVAPAARAAIWLVLVWVF